MLWTVCDNALWIIYYNYRNLTYYREARQISSIHLVNIQAPQTLAGVRLQMTNAFLATVGLTVVDRDEDTVPWYVLLSKVQRSWVRTVAKYGYKVGLK